MAHTGEVSGPMWLAMMLALATLLAAGVQALLAPQARDHFFIVSAALFSLSIFREPWMLRTTLALAALAAAGGTAFVLARWRRPSPSRADSQS